MRIIFGCLERYIPLKRSIIIATVRIKDKKRNKSLAFKLDENEKISYC